MRYVGRVLPLTTALLLGMNLAASPRLEKAPELRSLSVWINSDGPLKLSSLRGKVVLVDFWAFDCDPCKETIPRIETLHEKYAKDGLVVIGVHTPRTELEKQVPKLRDAVKAMGIRYPVVMDDKQKIFTDYRCDLWPTQFVIDKEGYIRLVRGGVSRYADVEEMVIQALKED